MAIVASAASLSWFFSGRDTGPLLPVHRHLGGAAADRVAHPRDTPRPGSSMPTVGRGTHLADASPVSPRSGSSCSPCPGRVPGLEAAGPRVDRHCHHRGGSLSVDPRASPGPGGCGHFGAVMGVRLHRARVCAGHAGQGRGLAATSPGAPSDQIEGARRLAAGRPWPRPW